MIVYGIGILPLIKNLKQEIPDITHPGPWSVIESKYVSILVNVPKTPASPAYQGCVMSGISHLRFLISGRIPIPYAKQDHWRSEERRGLA